MLKKKKLTKSKDKIFLGVFGGIADYFHLDHTIVRVIGALIFAFSGFLPMGIFYLLAAIVMPDADDNNHNSNIVDGEFNEK